MLSTLRRKPFQITPKTKPREQKLQRTSYGETFSQFFTIPRNANPPNCPQIRPIEDFWAALKQEVYAGGWEAKSDRQLKQRIRLKLKNMDLAVSKAFLARSKVGYEKSLITGSMRQFIDIFGKLGFC